MTQPAAGPAAVATVALAIDGAEGPPLAVPDGERVTLAGALSGDFPAPSTWKTVRARAGAQTLRLEVSRHRDHDLLLYRAAGGEPSLGLFRRNRAPGAEPRISLAGVEAIEIESQGAPGVAWPALELVAGKEATPVGRAELEDLPEVPWRAGKQEKSGVAWQLDDIVRLIIPPSQVGRVEITTGDDQSLAVSGEQLRSGAILVKRGDDGYMMKEIGAGGLTTRRARDVRRLTVFQESGRALAPSALAPR